MAIITDRHPLDTQNLIGVIESFPSQFKEALELAYNFHVEGEFDHIIWAGMGGSSWPGLLINDFLDGELKIDIHNNYGLPSWATANSLIICCSFSGNTEETIDSYEEAKQIGATIVVIATGGELIERAKKDSITYIQTPGGIQPRYGSGYTFAVGIALLQNSELISDCSDELKKLSDELEGLVDKEQSQIIARKLRDKSLFLYGPHELKSALYVAKIKFNENTKIHVTSNTFPELNHNEMSGFLDKHLEAVAILFHTRDQHPRVTKRMEIFQKLAEEEKVEVINYKLRGDTKLKQFFESIYLCDYLSYFLALDYEFDPTLVEFQENFKILMKQ